MGDKGTLSHTMDTWSRPFEHFKRKYGKAFMGNPLFTANMVDRIHKRVQIFLHSCNTPCLYNVVTGALLYFRELQRCVERVKWMTSIPISMELTTKKKDGGRNSDIGRGGRPGQAKQKMEAEKNRKTEPHLSVIENFRKLFNPACFEVHL